MAEQYENIFITSIYLNFSSSTSSTLFYISTSISSSTSSTSLYISTSISSSTSSTSFYIFTSISSSTSSTLFYISTSISSSTSSTSFYMCLLFLMYICATMCHNMAQNMAHCYECILVPQCAIMWHKIWHTVMVLHCSPIYFNYLIYSSYSGIDF